jgi:hypothetical protein
MVNALDMVQAVRMGRKRSIKTIRQGKPDHME